MPEIMFTTDGHPISTVRIVPATSHLTLDGNPITPVRLIYAAAGDVYTPDGFPVRAVRTVDAAGNYTTSQAAITTQPEDVYTADGNPIEAICLIASASSPEVVYTVDGRFIEAVRLVDAAGVLVPDDDPDLVLWVAAVVANGGTVSGARQSVVRTFITAEKAAGTWALTDDYWALWGENSQQALTSLKQRRLATVIGAPTFTVDRGYAITAATGINTGFVPATHGVTITGTNVRLAVYERVNFLSSGSIGCNESSGTRGVLVNPRSTGDVLFFSMNCQNVSLSLPSADSRGLTAGSRTGSVYEGWRNGLSRGTGAPGTNGTALPSVQPLYIGGLNNGGTLTHRLCSQGFQCIGAALTAGQELSQYNNIQAWATAVGAQV